MSITYLWSKLTIALECPQTTLTLFSPTVSDALPLPPTVRCFCLTSYSNYEGLFGARQSDLHTAFFAAPAVIIGEEQPLVVEIDPAMPKQPMPQVYGQEVGIAIGVSVGLVCIVVCGILFLLRNR